MQAHRQVLDESLVLFSDAARLPGRPRPSWLRLWRKRGLLAPDGTRVFLESHPIGKRLATSAEALRRFYLRVGGA